VQRFWQSSRGILPGGTSGNGYQVRWIGLDHDSTEQVLALIEAGDKTGPSTSATPPWMAHPCGR
jgi:hypothetical protein